MTKYAKEVSFQDVSLGFDLTYIRDAIRKSCYYKTREKEMWIN